MANFKTMKCTNVSWLPFFCLLIPSCLSYNVVNFGARGDGRTDSTRAFLRAWSAACNSASPSNVDVPRGTYLVRTLSFNGPCRRRITFRIDGTLSAPVNYNAIGNSEFWIMFYKVSGLTVYGSGAINANGHGYWSCRKSGGSCPQGARSIQFMWCNDVLLRGLTSLYSQRVHVGINYSSSVRVEYVKIIAPSGSPNTDGIHVQNSRGVTIYGSIIKTGDDCISIGSGSMNLWIEKVGCGPGHGISIGSLGNSNNEPGVTNVTVANSVFTKTQNGVRIKSWARASNGFVKNLMFRNLIMRNVGNPIIIDQNYCPHNVCPRQSSGVKVSQVTFKNVKGTSSTQAAMKFDCSPSNPCTGIRLQDIKLTYNDRMRRPAFTYCKNARGSHGGKVIPRSCI
ncbi:PREDICTED: polygalacturonase-like [Nicotiana attenuata]|uniref:Polygalacturonase n=1 Tax=Nicotiana attenuata TaxID=49451 RepID=A0A1J6IWC6_NICAT|nr:PREDICTED: polygalacturonase-like [Nicotiana attenuata]OIT02015.1 polygalacturonase [Nicotiana attenuata]